MRKVTKFTKRKGVINALDKRFGVGGIKKPVPKGMMKMADKKGIMSK